MPTSTQERNPAAWLDSLATSMELHAPDTYRHGRRTAAYAALLARRLDLSAECLSALEWGALLHDLGAIHIPDRILKKSGPLSEAERRMMKAHAITGYAMLSSIPSLSAIADLVLAHHERYDGTGYPHRLAGDDIPMGARICAVAECVDALTSPDERIRPVLPFPEACRHIGSQASTRFDPDVIDAFLSVRPNEWRQLRQGVAAPHGPARQRPATDVAEDQRAILTRSRER